MSFKNASIIFTIPEKTFKKAFEALSGRKKIGKAQLVCFRQTVENSESGQQIGNRLSDMTAAHEVFF